MKLTLANVKEIKRNSNSPLLKRVCNYVIDRWSEYDDKKHIFTDVLNYGCQSGVVGELIYYTDTVRFYKQYKQGAASDSFGRGVFLFFLRHPLFFADKACPASDAQDAHRRAAEGDKDPTEDRIGPARLFGDERDPVRGECAAHVRGGVRDA